MTAQDEKETATLASALPSRVAEKRDALGNLCFCLHLAVMIFIVTGWLMPWRGALLFYLAFLPAVAVQWQFNKNSCVLNNVESFIRTGGWRDPNNREEGAWLQTLLLGVTGIGFKPWQINLLTYSVLVLLWGLGLGHFLVS
jgi:hypothetical protein